MEFFLDYTIVTQVCTEYNEGDDYADEENG